VSLRREHQHGIRECHSVDTNEVRGGFAFGAADDEVLRSALGDQVRFPAKQVRPLSSCPLEWSDFNVDVEAWKERSASRGIYRQAGNPTFYYAVDWSTRSARHWAN
jgi:hypothetical protein